MHRSTIGLAGSVRLRWANAHYTWVSFKVQQFPNLQKYLYIFRRNRKRKLYKKCFIHFSSKFPGTPRKNVKSLHIFRQQYRRKMSKQRKSTFTHFFRVYTFLLYQCTLNFTHFMLLIVTCKGISDICRNVSMSWLRSLLIPCIWTGKRDNMQVTYLLLKQDENNEWRSVNAKYMLISKPWSGSSEGRLKSEA